jgi:hypothetical protein
LDFQARETPLPDSVSVEEQNSRLLALFAVNTNLMVSPVTHQLLVSCMGEPTDLKKCNRVVAWALYLLCETHVSLTAMGIAFGGNPKIEKTHLGTMSLIVELLFPKSIEGDPELGFIAVFLMLSHSLFPTPQI